MYNFLAARQKKCTNIKEIRPDIIILAWNGSSENRKGKMKKKSNWSVNYRTKKTNKEKRRGTHKHGEMWILTASQNDFAVHAQLQLAAKSLDCETSKDH